MNKKDFSRRRFIKQSSILGAAAVISPNVSSGFLIHDKSAAIDNKLAVLGGRPVFDSMRNPPQWPKWPLWIPQTDESRVLAAIRSGVWSRSKIVSEFEEEFAKMIGAKRCLTTVNGTNALICALKNLNVGGGDEVIISPYTFIASVQAILQVGAMPVFADTDPETFQINTNKIEEKITSGTRAILPVHICGLPADMKHIMEIAKKHNLAVVEDACQAHLAEIDHKKVGTFGDAGCFSFQNSKNLPIGEGGAIVSDNETFMDQCYTYHNYGLAYGSVKETAGAGFAMPGTKLRLTEYQAAIGLSQLKRLEAQTDTRNKNAAYLKSQLELIAGITPYKLYPGVTRSAFHLFPFRYDKKYFNGLEKNKFLQALKAEGVPCSGGYDTLNDKPFLKNTFQTKNFKKLYTREQLDWNGYLERNRCVVNDKLCKEEAVWFHQNMLLGTEEDMNYIALAVQKIYKNASAL